MIIIETFGKRPLGDLKQKSTAMVEENIAISIVGGSLFDVNTPSEAFSLESVGGNNSMHPEGFEPPTLGSEDRCSIH